MSTRQSKLKKTLKFLFMLSIIFYAILILTFLSNIIQFVIVELYMSLPIVMPVSFFYYCIVDTFTPNKKHSSLYGWFYAEFLEHFVLPFVLMFVLLLFPPIFILSYIILIFYFYGYHLGEINNFRDLISVLILTVLFIILIFYPDITFFINAYTNQGRTFIICSVIACGTLYFINKLRFAKNSIELLKGILVIIIMHTINAVSVLLF